MAFTIDSSPLKDAFSRWLPPHKGRILDVVERGLVLILYAAFAGRFLHRAVETSNLILLLLLASETLPVLLIMIRRSTEATSLRPGDWLLAFLGTVAPLLAVPAPLSPVIPVQFCGALILFGMMLQVAAKLALARSFGLVAANRGVRQKGPYRLIRHPMYAGYTLAEVGFLLASPSLINLLIYSAALSFQVMRILREERFLSAAPDYRAYARGVRYRLVPGLF